MADYTVISADSHMIEPPNLWTERLDRKYRDAAPHVEENERGSFFVAPGIQPSRVSLGFAAGRSGKELKEYFKKGGYEAARPSGWDPVERVKDQDIDGVVAEVLYTTFGSRCSDCLTRTCSARASRYTTIGWQSSDLIIHSAFTQSR
jgi:uncharacterized protein